MDPSELRRAARSAYEHARLRHALPWMMPGLAMAALTYLLLGQGTAWGIGAALAGLSVLARWRGGALGRAVLPGLLAGSPAWFLPLMAQGRWDTCSASCTLHCTVMAAAGGLIGGMVLWRRADHETAAAALGLGALAAAMGCLTLGVWGLVGVAALVIAGAPTMALRPRAA